MPIFLILLTEIQKKQTDKISIGEKVKNILFVWYAIALGLFPQYWVIIPIPNPGFCYVRYYLLSVYITQYLIYYHKG